MTYRPRSLGAVTAVALAVLAGCGASTTAPKATPAATAAASASGIPGCAQATAAVLAARKRINAQDYSGATTRIADLRDTLPHGKLQVDAALAAVKLAFLNEDVTQGNPVWRDIKDVYAALDVIGADCGSA